MDWPISWNDVKNSLLPVVEVSEVTSTALYDQGQAFATTEEITALTKAAENASPVIFKFMFNGIVTMSCLASYSNDAGVSYYGICGDGLACKVDAHYNTGNWGFTLMELE